MLNQVILIGRVGRDAEVTSAGQSRVMKFSLATTEKWMSAAGKKQEKTTWHECEMWGKVDNLARYVTTGSVVGVTGSIDVSDYTDKQGNKKKFFKIRVFKLTLISSKGPREEEPEDDEPVPDDDVPF